MCGGFKGTSVLVGRLVLAGGLTATLVACGGGGNNDTIEQFPTQPVTIDVLSALVTPSYTLDIGSGPVVFPSSEYDDGNFVLRGATEPNDIAPLGSSHDENPAEVRVVQGGYDVLFQHETGDTVPQNVDSLVQTVADISVVADPFPIAVKAWTVTPTFLHNGGAFPVSEYDDGVFYLRPTAGGEDVFLGNSHTVSPAPVLVMQGSYDVIYSLETGGSLVPSNQAAVVMSGEPITSDRPSFVVNVTSERFSFNPTHNSGGFPSSQYQRAEFFLRNASGDRVELGASFEPPAPPFVIVGTYDIVYQHVQGDLLPINRDAVLMGDVLIDASNQSQAPDITSVSITPTFSLDASPFQESEYQDANFFLRGYINNNDEILLGSSHISTPDAVRIISSADVGNYDVLYRHESGETVPQNTNAVVLSNDILNMDGALVVFVAFS